MKQIIQEYLNPAIVNGSTEVLSEGADSGKKSLYMKGIFMQGNVRNANQRVYPAEEIRRAVNSLKEQINQTNGVLGQLSHPDNLVIDPERASHVITDIFMEGFDGVGKLKIIETPVGLIAKAILDAKVKLGVSTRGSGNVNESTGQVSDFEIVTVDLVVQPSAPDAFPTPIYEGLMNMKHGYKGLEIAQGIHSDPKAQKYLKEFVTNFIKDLKVK